MIQVQPFNIDILSTHKCFFLLNHLPKNSSEIDVWIQTPIGYESVDFVDIFSMNDGSLLAAWRHPLQKLGLQNLVAFADGITQVLNLYPLERIIDIYDRPVDSSLGTFNFLNSHIVDSGDWRCDRGYYGAKPFAQEVNERVFKSIEDIAFYEAFLSVAGIGHFVYMESTRSSNQELAIEKLNNSIAPTTGRTLQEVFRLIYEWSVLADDPFNSTDDAAVAAKKYIEALKLTEEEISVLRNLPQMQISNFILGSDSARVRPSHIPSLSSDVAKILFKRMASSSLSFIHYLHPELTELENVLSAEQDQLEAGIQRFRDFYQIPNDWPISDTERIIEHCTLYFNPTIGPYVHNQLRLFTNKQHVLDRVAAGTI